MVLLVPFFGSQKGTSSTLFGTMFASWRDFLKTKITLFYSHFSLFLALSTQQNDFVCSSGELHHENCDQEVSSILLTWIPSQVSIYIRCSAPEYPFSEFGGKILPHLRSFGPFWIFDIGKSFFGVGKTKIICFHTFWILSADCIWIQRKQKPDPIWNSERPSRPSLPISERIFLPFMQLLPSEPITIRFLRTRCEHKKVSY